MQQPLADRMRPRNFDEFVGQEHIVGKGKLLRKLIENDELASVILWGPPGVGKTTLAHIIAEQTKSRFVALSAVMSGKEELRKVIEEAKRADLASPSFQGGVADITGGRGGLPSLADTDPSSRQLKPRQTTPARREARDPSLERRGCQRTILFVDEIHRWNKAQQDALLPYVERGEIILIGATTENPSFEIIGALLSRSRVFVLKRLETPDIVEIIKRAFSDKERGLGKHKVDIKKETIELLAELAGGDARVALNAVEMAVKAKTATPHPASLSQRERGKRFLPPLGEGQRMRAGSSVTLISDDIKEALQRTHLVFDKKGEEFYNVISALHKSMRGGDANAALYWLARMLEGGVDPLYVARRVLRFASEDIGMANSEALIQANAAYDACHKIGMPECTVHLAQAVVYCAKSAKSNVLYTAYQKASEDARNTSHLGVPLHIRNAPTKLLKEIGYGKGYKYSPDYDYEEKQDYLPEELKGRNYLKK